MLINKGSDFMPLVVSIEKQIMTPPQVGAMKGTRCLLRADLSRDHRYRAVRHTDAPWWLEYCLPLYTTGGRLNLSVHFGRV